MVLKARKVKTTFRDAMKINCSEIFILPIFNTEQIKSSFSYEYFKFSLLAYEYGLKKTFLYTNIDYSGRNLYLLFSKKVLSNLNITQSNYYNFRDRILNKREFVKEFTVGDNLLFQLQIPTEFQKDVELIKNGKYGQLSMKYKRRVIYADKELPKTAHHIGRTLVRYQIPYAICEKQSHIRKELESAMNEKINVSREYWGLFFPALFSNNEIKSKENKVRETFIFK